MPKFRLVATAIAIAAVPLLVFAEPASAQKRAKKEKLTFEQAWAKCTPYAQQVPEWNVQGRTARGKDCMLRYGYRI